MSSDLYPYQRQGAEFLARHPRAYLADEMGLGKTPQAIAACDLADITGPVLVICPAIARYNWQVEFDRWQQIPRPIEILDGRSKRACAGVNICSYDFARANKALLRWEWSVVILDEAHFLKNPKAKRTQSILGRGCDGAGGVVEGAERLWCLSGTPAPNDASELWSALKALGIEERSYWRFIDAYCVQQATNWGARIVGQKNIADLKARIRPYFLRRRTAEVLTDLPELRWATVTLPPATSAATIDRLEKEAGIDASDIEMLVDEGGVQLSRLRRAYGLAKVTPVAELIEEEMEAGHYRKAVVFAHHRDVLANLRQRFDTLGAAVIDGSTPDGERQGIIRDFQTKPKPAVLLGQITACATAITLTAARHVFFVEPSWTPAENMQATKRCHRIGQRDSVLARFVCCQGNLDEAIMRVLERKTRMIAELMDHEREVA